MKTLRDAISILFISVVLLEVIGLFLVNGGYFWGNRFMYVGPDNYRILEDGLWTYAPDSHILDAASYAFYFGEPFVEYVCEFDTNEFGIIKTTLTPKDSRDIDLLVLGDSFVEGQAGCSWINEDTTKDLGMNVLNGGLQSAGVSSFLVLETFLLKSLNIKNVAVVVIADDFFRGVSNAFITLSRTCSDTDDCAKSRSHRYPIGPGPVNGSRLNAVTSARYDFRFGDFSISRLMKEASFYSFTLEIYFKLSSFFAGAPKLDMSLFEKNVDAMLSLKARYPLLDVIFVPQKPEVGLLSGLSLQSNMVISSFKENNIDFKICEMTSEDYMYIDGHPNAQGYQKIYACVFDK